MNAIHYFSSSDMAWMIRRTLPLVCLLATLVSPQVVRAGAQAVQTGAQAVSPDSLQTTPLPAPVTPPQRQGVRIVLHTESAAPVCLAMDAHGALYVADEKAGTIRCVTRDGESGLLVSGLHAPCAIAVSHHRELVVGTRLGEICLLYTSPSPRD